MAMEIERKFIIETVPSFVFDYNFTTIEQTYISVKPEIRVRRENDKFILTRKGEGTLSRAEEETFISEANYKKESITHPIIKKRYRVPIQNGYIAEVDIFEGYLSGLITVEVEFQTEQDSKVFIPPFWFGKEVTEDVNYKNKNLASLK